jgi:hypothetical protein
MKWETELLYSAAISLLRNTWNFLSFQPHYGPGVDSASNRNEYQEPFWGVKGGRRGKADNLTAICEPIV